MKNESTFGTIKSLSSFLTGFGIRQVKSRITGATQLTQVIDKLSVAAEIVCKPIFSGIFSFEGYDGILNRNVNQQVRSTLIRGNGKVNHLCIGENCFIKYWPEYTPKQENVRPHWAEKIPISLDIPTLLRMSQLDLARTLTESIVKNGYFQDIATGRNAAFTTGRSSWGLLYLIFA